MSDDTGEDRDRGLDPTTEAIRFLSDEEISGGQPPLRFASTEELPHWSEPPSGEYTPIADRTNEEDLEAWASFATAPVWREDSSTDSFDHLADLTSEVPIKVGTPRDDTSEDFFAIPEEPARVTSISSRLKATPPGTGRRVEAEPSPSTAGASGRNLPVAIGVGLGLAALALALFKAGPRYAMILVVAVLVAAVVEFYDALRRSKFQPASLVGIVATALMPVAAYNDGPRGMLLVLVLASFATLIWYVIVDTDSRATVNVAVTIAGMVWVGMLGSYAALMLAMRDSATKGNDGIGILLACIVGTVAHDVFALAGGSLLGRSPIAPRVSPNKTVEGLIVGVLGAVAGPVALSSFLHPWDDDPKKSLYVGLVIAIVAPLGDLAESLVKRDLGLKDMGSLLPGHGGVFDRFDALLFTLPATYYVVEVLHLPGLG